MSELKMRWEGSADAVEEAMRDYNDGAAMRRLRGASRTLVVSYWEDHEEPWTVVCGDSSAHGATIAEAAERCLENVKVDKKSDTPDASRSGQA
jgi:hypothetical protein